MQHLNNFGIQREMYTLKQLQFETHKIQIDLIENFKRNCKSNRTQNDLFALHGIQ